MIPKRRDHLRFQDLVLLASAFSQKPRSKMTTKSFSHQNDIGLRALTPFIH